MEKCYCYLIATQVLIATQLINVKLPFLKTTIAFSIKCLHRYKNNLITWYDEQYNKRPREEGDRLPDLRKWDGNKLAWVPERTDYPMQGKYIKTSILATFLSLYGYIFVSICIIDFAIDCGFMFIIHKIFRCDKKIKSGLDFIGSMKDTTEWREWVLNRDHVDHNHRALITRSSCRLSVVFCLNMDRAKRV